MTKDIREIPLRDIDIHDESLRFGQRGDTEPLKRSIAQVGLLEPLLLLRKGETLQVVQGFHRISAVTDLGWERVPGKIIEDLEGDECCRLGLVHAFERGLGLMGSLRFLHVLGDRFKISQEETRNLGRQSLGIPKELLPGEALFVEALALPEEMHRYFDSRDLAFRHLRDYLRLSPQSREGFAQVLGEIPLRTNLFRKVLELLIDIEHRDGEGNHFPPMGDLRGEEVKDGEKIILDYLFALRYPRYNTLRKKAEEHLGRLSVKDVTLEFPHYFEGKSVKLSVLVKRGEGIEDICKKITALDEEEFLALMEML